MSTFDRRLPNELKTCPACGSGKLAVFHSVDAVPVHSVMNVPTREKALSYPRGRIDLACCQYCSFVYNASFEPSLVHYDSGYESTQTYSETFRSFAKRLASQMIESYGLTEKRLLEIGCGNGEFLHLICTMGNNTATGFDPAFRRDRLPPQAAGSITVVKDFYSEKYHHVAADFVFCRMTLEHIFAVGEFVASVRAAIGSRTVPVLFQVPDVTRILRDCAFEDIYYEHCSYFSPASLSSLFAKSGFDVTETLTDFGGQYLILTALPRAPGRPDPEPRPDEVSSICLSASDFSLRYDDKRRAWRRRLAGLRRDGGRVVLWGSGSKAVSFLTSLGLRDVIEYAVDINPHREGTYLAGCGQRVVSPDFLAEYRPAAVIVMNRVYREEIERQLTSMGLTPVLYEL
jgi:hypothetical protein